MIHLDTSFVIDLIREARQSEPGSATRRLEAVADERMGLSLHVLCELRAGAELARDGAAEHGRIDLLCERLEVVLPDERLPPVFGRLLAGLQRQGTSIGTMDLLIGATALVDEAPLVTANTRHFARVPGLRLIGY